MTDYYDDYFFTSSQEDFQCPDIPFACDPLSACARDPNTGSSYCCDHTNNACWSGSTPCATDGSTQNCGSGENSWCCLDKTEVCTQTKGQINICWNKAPSILVNISSDALAKVYSSLSSASPAASSFIFTPLDLIAQTQPAPKSTSTHSSSASTTSRPSSKPAAGTPSSALTGSAPTNPPTSIASSADSQTSPSISSTTYSTPSVATSSSAESSASLDDPAGSPSSHVATSHLPSGAIAGIVIGSVALIVFIIVAVLYFLQQRKKERTQTAAIYEAMQKPDGTAFYPGAQAAPYSAAPSELPSHMYRTRHELAGDQ